MLKKKRNKNYEKKFYIATGLTFWLSGIKSYVWFPTLNRKMTTLYIQRRYWVIYRFIHKDFLWSILETILYYLYSFYGYFFHIICTLRVLFSPYAIVNCMYSFHGYYENSCEWTISGKHYGNHTKISNLFILLKIESGNKTCESLYYFKHYYLN